MAYGVEDVLVAQLDKASDYESEDWGFKSLQGLTFSRIIFQRGVLQGYLHIWWAIDVPVAQWIAHQTSNLGVAGSNPVECFWFV